MPLTTFQYSARDRAGRLTHGSLNAETDLQVADWLLTLELSPIDITVSGRFSLLHQQPARILDWVQRAHYRLPAPELLLLTRQLRTLLGARVPIAQALAQLATAARSRALRHSLAGLLQDVGRGRTLSQAAAAQPRAFPLLYPALLELGETAGDLPGCLDRLHSHLQGQRDMRRKLVRALTYPLLVLASISAAITVFTLHVIPQFAGLFERNDVPLPLATRILILLGDGVSRSGPYVIGTLVVLSLFWVLAARSPAGRRVRGECLLRTPLFGRLVRMGEQARFASTLALAYGSGLSLERCLELCRASAGNAACRQRIERMRHRLDEGERFTDAAEQARFLDPMSLEMLRVGEETGRLVETTTEVADSLQREWNESLDRVGAAIGPAMTIGLALLVLVMVLGVLMPMWDLSRVLMP